MGPRIHGSQICEYALIHGNLHLCVAVAAILPFLLLHSPMTSPTVVNDLCRSQHHIITKAVAVWANHPLLGYCLRPSHKKGDIGISSCL